MSSNTRSALSGKFLKCSGRIPAGFRALPDITAWRLLLSSSRVKSFSISCLVPHPLSVLATSIPSLLVLRGDFLPLISAYSLTNASVLAFVVAHHLPLWNMAPPPSLSLLAPSSLLITLQALLKFLSSLIFSRCFLHVSLLAYTVFSLSSLQMPMYSLLLLPMSFPAWFLLFLSLYISAVIHGMTADSSTSEASAPAASARTWSLQPHGRPPPSRQAPSPPYRNRTPRYQPASPPSASPWFGWHTLCEISSYTLLHASGRLVLLSRFRHLGHFSFLGCDCGLGLSGYCVPWSSSLSCGSTGRRGSSASVGSGPGGVSAPGGPSPLCTEDSARKTSFVSFILMLSSTLTSSSRSLFRSLFLCQFPFLIFGSVLLAFLLILISQYQPMRTSTWSDERSSMVLQFTPLLPSIVATVRSGVDLPGSPGRSSLSNCWYPWSRYHRSVQSESAPPSARQSHSLLATRYEWVPQLVVGIQVPTPQARVS